MAYIPGHPVKASKKHGGPVMRICSAFLFVLLSSSSALAIPAITCHCFRVRTFDPEKPAAADPYFLATTQNSFFAAVFGVEKKEVVRAKMTGTSSAELWISHYVAAGAGISPEAVEKVRREASSWQAVLASLYIPGNRLGAEFEKVLASRATPESLATAAVDAALVAHFGADPDDLRQLRSAGATDAETILAVFLSRESGRPALGYRAEVVEGRETWGSLLAKQGINPSAIDSEVRRLLR
jgi:hypothetical protein